MESPKSDSREVQIIETEDGSHSLYVPSLNETYHSFHGAIRESRHVFIKQGLEHWLFQNEKNRASILEIGFGTGLNALLAIEIALLKKVNIFYHTLEPYPLEDKVVKLLNYPALMQNESLQEYFSLLHTSAWNEPIALDPFFTIQKQLSKLEEFNTEAHKFDVVFFDAFAPNKQAELWTYEMLEKVYNLMAPNGILVTYCAKGQLKRDLKSIGFEVETLPGPPGKKEMVRGGKKL